MTSLVVLRLLLSLCKFLLFAFAFLYLLAFLCLDNLDVERECQDGGNTSYLIEFFGLTINEQWNAASLRDLRCPDSCMLENMMTSPPFDCTSSTI